MLEPQPTVSLRPLEAEVRQILLSGADNAVKAERVNAALLEHEHGEPKSQ